MSTRDQILEVEQVIFESGDPEVNVKGTITQGFLSYETEIIGESDSIKYAIHRALQVADTDSTVLLEGETGVESVSATCKAIP